MFLARELQINLEDFESQIKKPIKIFPPSKEGQKSESKFHRTCSILQNAPSYKSKTGTYTPDCYANHSNMRALR